MLDEDYALHVIADHFGVPVEMVRRDSVFTSDLGADSLDLVELSMRLESEFNIHLDDDQVETCSDVGSALRILHELVSSGAQSMPDMPMPMSSPGVR